MMKLFYFDLVLMQHTPAQKVISFALVVIFIDLNIFTFVKQLFRVKNLLFTPPFVFIKIPFNSK